jgi:arsenate reductase
MPTSVRPQAAVVLREIGIDIGGQRSKGVNEIERPVDVVITLCAEEVCPVWLGDALRLHWALPDPAAVEGTDEQKLDAFRRVRDELSGRLGVFFGLHAPTFR